MKVCIVTVYNSSNYGSFLQANALQTVLKEKGHDVYFLKNGARDPNKDVLRILAKKALKFETNGYGYQFKKMKIFSQISKAFKECTFDEANEMDLVVLGSDEIWNAKRERIRKFHSFFGGDIKEEVRKIAYAPSINDASKEDFENHEEILTLLRNVDEVTVRDLRSKKVLEEFLDKDISVVTDPTMLLEREFYLKDAIKPKLTDYIVVYSYGHMLTKESITQLKAYAKENNKKIVSVLEYFPWADLNLSLLPNELLGYFSNADFIFTDTFHGTVFSIILNKQFVHPSKNSPKIAQLLENFSIESRSLIGTTIEHVLENEIDFYKVNEILKEKRGYSHYILENMLNGGEK